MGASQVNVEYWFKVLYDLFYFLSGGTSYTELAAFAAHAWIWVIIVGYTLSAAALFVIVYTTVRIQHIRHEEEKFYGTTLLEPGDEDKNPRWAHIQELMGSVNPSDWRTAIIEADILLDDVLSRQGYDGAGVGEKLKNVDRADFNTLQDAWEAHKVRNQIAHEGSSFDLSPALAQRTIGRYEAVFREFNLI